MKTKKLPIGYWIKQADNLLTEKIDSIQSGFGLDRTGWQVLNSLHETGGMRKDQVVQLMAPFAEPAKVEEILSRLRTKNRVIVSEEDHISLTEEGEKIFRDCLALQKEFRTKAMQGITEKDYEITILTLQQIIRNIEE